MDGSENIQELVSLYFYEFIAAKLFQSNNKSSYTAPFVQYHQEPTTEALSRYRTVT